HEAVELLLEAHRAIHEEAVERRAKECPGAAGEATGDDRRVEEGGVIGIDEGPLAFLANPSRVMQWPGLRHLIRDGDLAGPRRRVQVAGAQQDRVGVVHVAGELAPGGVGRVAGVRHPGPAAGILDAPAAEALANDGKGFTALRIHGGEAEEIPSVLHEAVGAGNPRGDAELEGPRRQPLEGELDLELMALGKDADAIGGAHGAARPPNRVTTSRGEADGDSRALRMTRSAIFSTTHPKCSAPSELTSRSGAEFMKSMATGSPLRMANSTVFIW